MTDTSCTPDTIDRVAWIDVSRLELRDTRLTEVQALLSCAEDLIHDILARNHPEAKAPSVAAEINLLADQLAHLPEYFEGSEDNPVLLRRAAVMCAGAEWIRLGGLLPSLRLRLSFVAEAIAETAVGLSRLRRSGPQHPSGVPDSDTFAAEIAADEEAIREELRRRAARAGAENAYAAADGAFLPSLTDFLR
ncbi:hypothetical protein acdb102_33920 [Acidothermaceae bacterium B102]|nr:hypothetical protein acdb102_33920 [Acidothermaceae bacterium B102]